MSNIFSFDTDVSHILLRITKVNWKKCMPPKLINNNVFKLFSPSLAIYTHVNVCVHLSQRGAIEYNQNMLRNILCCFRRIEMKLENWIWIMKTYTTIEQRISHTFMQHNPYFPVHRNEHMYGCEYVLIWICVYREFPVNTSQIYLTIIYRSSITKSHQHTTPANLPQPTSSSITSNQPSSSIIIDDIFPSNSSFPFQVSYTQPLISMPFNEQWKILYGNIHIHANLSIGTKKWEENRN